GPGIVSRRLLDACATRRVFLIKSSHVFYSNPGPCARRPLSPLAQVNASPIPSDCREIIATPVSVLEAERIHIIANSSRHICNAQNRICMLKSGAFQFRLRLFRAFNCKEDIFWLVWSQA